MAPIVEVSDEVFGRMNPNDYIRREDLEVPKQEQVADLDRSNWIVIPRDFTGGKYSLDVSPGRLAYCPAVEEAGRKLELRFANTSRDSLGREFIGGDSSEGLAGNWFEFLKLNLALGCKTPNMREINNFGRLLDYGRKGKRKVHDVSGTILKPEYLEQVFSDIFGVMSPWRGEWLDDDFKVKRNTLYHNSSHILGAYGKLVPQYSEILDKETLMKDRCPGISLDDWLNNSTEQGFPNREIKSGDLYYWHPRDDDDSVARVIAGGGRVVIGCYRSPSDGGASLGVRAAKQRE